MSINLARDSSIPLHEQLKLEVYRKIDKGEWRPDERIPSERELCDTYDVSRITVRQAIADAVVEGRLYRQHGKGTFVSRPHIEQGLSRITTFSSTMQGLGLHPTTKLLEASAETADMVLAKVLDIPIGGNVLALTLLGLGSEQPMVFYDSTFPYDIGKELLDRSQEWIHEGKAFSTYDLYDRGKAEYPKFCDQTFEAVAAPSELAERLQIAESSPLFVITSVFYSPQRRPLEFRKAYYRGEAYRFHLEREFE